MSTGAPTVRSLDNRMDDLEKDFLIFQARIDLIVSLLKWVAGFSLASMLAVIIQMLSISFYAGNLQGNVNTQGTAVGKLQDKLDAQGTATQEIKADVREMKKDIAAQGTAIQEIRGELRELKKDIAAQGTAIQEIRGELRELKKEVTAQGTAIQEIKAELRDIRKDLGLIRDELKKLNKDK